MWDVGINVMTDNMRCQIGLGFFMEEKKKESVVSVGYTYHHGLALIPPASHKNAFS